MGHRANFVIVENGAYKIYYSGRGAHYTPHILAQGLAFCEQYFKEFTEESVLMDNAWGEGGVLIDKDKKNALVFGGGWEFHNTPALQRLYCKRVVQLWPNWTIRWCDQGAVDFAEYLGIMEDSILAEGREPDFLELNDFNRQRLLEMRDDMPQCEVITLIKDGIVNDYSLDWGFDGMMMLIQESENLIHQMPEQLKIKKWKNEVEVTNCLLADYDTKKIFVCWGINTDKRYDEAVRQLWHGWEVKRQTEGLIFHFDYTNRDKSIVEMTEEQFDDYCKESKLFEFNPKKK